MPGFFVTTDQNQTAFQALPERVQQWLTDPGSLTEKLIAFEKNIRFVVRSDQKGMQADAGAQTALKIDSTTPVRVRIIAFSHQREPWIKACTIIPATSITKETAALNNIGNTPIGKILFADPTLQRSHFTFYKSGNDWVRESCFQFKNQPVFIREVFCESFLQKLQETQHQPLSKL